MSEKKDIRNFFGGGARPSAPVPAPAPAPTSAFKSKSSTVQNDDDDILLVASNTAGGDDGSEDEDWMYLKGKPKRQGQGRKKTQKTKDKEHKEDGDEEEDSPGNTHTNTVPKPKHKPTAASRAKAHTDSSSSTSTSSVSQAPPSTSSTSRSHAPARPKSLSELTKPAFFSAAADSSSDESEDEAARFERMEREDAEAIRRVKEERNAKLSMGSASGILGKSSDKDKNKDKHKKSHISLDDDDDVTISSGASRKRKTIDLDDDEEGDDQMRRLSAPLVSQSNKVKSHSSAVDKTSAIFGLTPSSSSSKNLNSNSTEHSHTSTSTSSSSSQPKTVGLSPFPSSLSSKPLPPRPRLAVLDEAAASTPLVTGPATSSSSTSTSSSSTTKSSAIDLSTAPSKPRVATDADSFFSKAKSPNTSTSSSSSSSAPPSAAEVASAKATWEAQQRQRDHVENLALHLTAQLAPGETERLLQKKKDKEQEEFEEKERQKAIKAKLAAISSSSSSTSSSLPSSSKPRLPASKMSAYALDIDEMEDDDGAVEIPLPRPVPTSTSSSSSSSSSSYDWLAPPSSSFGSSSQLPFGSPLKRKDVPMSPAKTPSSTSSSSSFGASSTTPSKGGAAPTDADDEDGSKRAKLSWKDQKAIRDARGPPPMAGRKEIPDGEPSCLEGLTFVITGVLESLEREDASDLIKKYGGKVTSAVSGKTSFVLAGSEPGDSKIKTSKEKNVKVVDENYLFDLIRTRQAGGSGTMGSASSAKPKKAPASAQLSVSPLPLPSSPSPSTGNAVASAAHPGPASLSSSSSSSMSSVSRGSPSRPSVPFPVSGSPSPHSIALWVDRYRPKRVEEIIGNNANVTRIQKWLSTWYSIFGHGDGPKGAFKALLLSGRPGLGKTTAATLLGTSMGFDVIEMNASDVRSKNSLQDKVVEALKSHGLGEFFAKPQASGAPPPTQKKKLLIMDEIDGIAGNEDRGGLQSIISLIHKTRTPIICICNDGQSIKIRSLKGHCEALTWAKPTVLQVVPRLMNICKAEHMVIDQPALEKLADSTQCDIRQMLNFLQMWSKTSKHISFDQVKSTMANSHKDFESSIFDDVPELFRPIPISMSRGQGQPGLGHPRWIDDRSNLVFKDFSMMSLFVQENYLAAGATPFVPYPRSPDVAALLAVSAAADAMSEGDMMDKLIMNTQDHDLMPLQAVMSAIMPGFIMSGGIRGRTEFPKWLGNNSSARKKSRLVQELLTWLSLEVRSDLPSFALEYLPILRDRLVSPFMNGGGSGSNGVEAIEEAISLLDELGLTREDFTSIMEVTENWSSSGASLDMDSRVKAAFTRKYNATGHKLKVARTGKANAGNDISKGKKMKVDEEGAEEDEEGEDEEEEDEKETEKEKEAKDIMIKEEKVKGGGEASAGSSSSRGRGGSSASSSSSGARGRGATKPRGGGRGGRAGGGAKGKMAYDIDDDDGDF